MIIGISGKMGCGKSTLARHLSKRTGYPVFSFAGKLKEEVSEIYNIPMKFLNEKKDMIVFAAGFEKPMTIRELLQEHGSERRAQDANHWIKLLAEELPPDAIIDDLRYRNEAAFIRSRGGVLIRLEPYEGWNSNDGHHSETDLDDFPDFDLIYRPAYGTLTETAEDIVYRLKLK